MEKNNDKGGLEKYNDKVESESTNLQFPPGFTPDVGQENDNKTKKTCDSQPKEDLIGTKEPSFYYQWD